MDSGIGHTPIIIQVDGNPGMSFYPGDRLYIDDSSHSFILSYPFSGVWPLRFYSTGSGPRKN
jgi:hypothetical protein